MIFPQRSNAGSLPARGEGLPFLLLAQVAKSGDPLETRAVAALSDREREVLSLLARGMTNVDIAEHLSLAEGTVWNYVSSILSKVQVTDRAQVAILALRYGLANL